MSVQVPMDYHFIITIYKDTALQDILKFQRRISEANWHILHNTYKKPGSTWVIKTCANYKYYAQNKNDLIKIFKLIIKDQNLIMDQQLIAIGLIEDPAPLKAFLLALEVGMFGEDSVRQKIETDSRKAFLEQGLLLIKADYGAIMEASNHLNSLLLNNFEEVNNSLNKFSYENFLDAAAALGAEDLQTRKWGHQVFQSLVSKMTGHHIINEKIRPTKMLSHKHQAVRYLGRFLSAIFSYDNSDAEWLPFDDDHHSLVLAPNKFISTDLPTKLPCGRGYAPNDCYPIGEPFQPEFFLTRDRKHHLFKQILKGMAKERDQSAQRWKNNDEQEVDKALNKEVKRSRDAQKAQTAIEENGSTNSSKRPEVDTHITLHPTPLPPRPRPSSPVPSPRPRAPSPSPLPKPRSTSPARRIYEPATKENGVRASWMVNNLFTTYVDLMLKKYFFVDCGPCPAINYHEIDLTDEAATEPNLFGLDLMRYNNAEIACLRMPVHKNSICSNMLRNGTIIKWIETMNRFKNNDESLPSILSDSGPAVLPMATPVDEQKWPRNIHTRPRAIKYIIDAEEYMEDDCIFRFSKDVAAALRVYARRGKEVWMSLAVAIRKVYDQEAEEKHKRGLAELGSPSLITTDSETFLSKYGHNANGQYSLGEIRILIWQQATSIIWNGQRLEHDALNKAATLTAKQIVKFERNLKITRLMSAGEVPSYDRAFRNSFLGDIICEHCDSTPAIIIITSNVRHGLTARCDVCGLHTNVKTHRRLSSREPMETIV